MSPSTTTPNTPPSISAAREIRRDTPLRRARTCYTHLAGLAGVTLTDTLLSRRWIEEAGISRGRVDYRLTPSGEEALLDRGVIIPVPSRTQRYSTDASTGPSAAAISLEALAPPSSTVSSPTASSPACPHPAENPSPTATP